MSGYLLILNSEVIKFYKMITKYVSFFAGWLPSVNFSLSFFSYRWSFFLERNSLTSSWGGWARLLALWELRGERAQASHHSWADFHWVPPFGLSSTVLKWTHCYWVHLLWFRLRRSKQSFFKMVESLGSTWLPVFWAWVQKCSLAHFFLVQPPSPSLPEPHAL